MQLTKIEHAYVIGWAKKIKAIQILGGKCELCGETHIFKLCFHHKTNKNFEIGKHRWLRWSSLLKELGDCQLLCQNCHRELHSTKESLHSKGKQVLLSYKNLSECSTCGYDTCEGSLLFHHVSDKSFGLGEYNFERFLSVAGLKEKIKTELDNCIVICANCHQIEHIDVAKFIAFRDVIYDKVSSYKENPSKVDRRLITELKGRGLRNIDIARQLGCSKSTVTYALHGSVS